MNNLPNNQQASTDGAMQAQDYWQIIKNRYGILLLVFILVMLTAAGITAIMTKKYSTKISFELKRDRTSADVAVRDDIGQNDSRQFYGTQFAIIRSRELLRKAVERVELDKRWKKSLDATVGELKGSVQVNNERETDIVDLTVTSHRRDDVVLMAEAVTNAYRDHRAEVVKSRIQDAMLNLEKHIAQQQDVVFDYEQRMRELSKEHGIIYDGAGGGRLPNETSEFMSRDKKLQEQRDQVKRLEQTVSNLDNLNDVELITAVVGLTLPVAATVDSVYTKFQDAVRARESMMSGGLGPKHPKVIAATTNLATIKRQLDDRVLEVRKTLKETLELEKSQLSHLQLASDTASGNMIELSQALTDFNTVASQYHDARGILRDMKTKLRDLSTQESFLMDAITVTAKPIEPDPDNPVSPKWKLNMALGSVAGLIFGVGIAFALELMDTSVKSIEDVERYLQVPVLAVIPKDIGVLHRINGVSPDAEAYRILRTNIEFNRKDASQNAITVVSGGAGEGKSTTMVNLAYICAQGGYSTLMIDADLRRPRLHTFFDTKNDVGLTNYLTTDLQLEDVILKTAVNNLYFLPSGVLPTDASGILNSRRMSDMIADVKNRFDLILVDSPPILGVSDAAVISSEVDLTMIVVQHRKMPRNMLVRVKQAVENVGGTVLGVVLNNVDVQSDAQYQYYTSYYTYYSPDDTRTATDAPVFNESKAERAASKEAIDNDDIY